MKTEKLSLIYTASVSTGQNRPHQTLKVNPDFFFYTT